MMTRHFTLALLTIALLATAPSRATAHEGHDHKVLGTVTMAAADHLMLEDRSGKPVTILVTKETKVKATPALKVEEIKPGTRVVVTATMQKDKTLKAKTIEVGAAPGAAK
jgi:hypothetical protein